MSTFSTGLGRVAVDLSGGNPSNPTIYNLSMPLAATEYSYALPANTSRYLIKTRSGARLKLSFVSGQTATNYITIPPHNWYADSQVSTTSPLTLYVMCDSASEILEIVSWS